MKQTFKELIESSIQYLEHQDYSPIRINYYKMIWKSKLAPFMVKKSELYYNPSIGEEFIRSIITGSLITHSERDIIRGINVLSEYQEKGTINKSSRKLIKYELNGQIGLLMEKFLLYLESLRRSKVTISDHRLYLSRFLYYLDSKQVIVIEEVRESHILSFLSTQTNNKIGTVSTIRCFFKYLFEENLIHSDLTTVLQYYKWIKKEKLPSVYSAKEILQIESSIYRGNATGKRDYAMVLLATRLGLRASDIANLTFNNLDWDSSIIKLSQIKTNKLIELPLLIDVGESIIDYLKFGRKKSDLKHIFISTRAPYTFLLGCSVTTKIRSLINASGVDTTGRKHGSHALRHSLAAVFWKTKCQYP